MIQTSAHSTPSPLGWLTAKHSFPDLCTGLTRLAVVVGLCLRILEYADNRGLYMDEGLLLQNLTDLPVWDLHTVLTKDQLAPPGFLVVERMMVRLPFPIIPSARLVPFLAAILTMFYFPKVARRYLDPWAVPLATALFALGDYSIYYASEIKQYSVEVALALMALGLVARVEDAPDPAARRNRLVVLAIAGVAGVWFSLPLIFSLAGIGLAGFAGQVFRRDRKGVGAWMAVGLTWLISFGGCFLVADRIVTKAPFLRTWWDFAFLRIPPRSMEEAIGVFWQLVNVVIGPTGVVSPLPHVWTGLLCCPLIVYGTITLWRRSPAKAFVIVAPFLVAVIASALKHYPFHGRLIQFLIPSVIFVLAEGVAAIGRKGRIGLAIGIVLAAFLVFQPTVDVLYFRLIRGRARPWDTHGDLHNDLLDERDAAAKGRPATIQFLPRE